MIWILLSVGLILFGIGIGAQVRGRAKARESPADDSRARRWVVTVGTVVVGAWLVALSATHLIFLIYAAHQ